MTATRQEMYTRASTCQLLGAIPFSGKAESNCCATNEVPPGQCVADPGGAFRLIAGGEGVTLRRRRSFTGVFLLCQWRFAGVVIASGA